MKWKRSKKAISESHKKVDCNQPKSSQENEDISEIDIAEGDDESDIDISDEPTIDIDQKSEIDQRLLGEDQRIDLHRNLNTIDLSRSNPYLQSSHLQTTCFTQDTNVISSAVS